MMNSLRSWRCRDCGRSTQAEVERDGSAKCTFCGCVTRIQPSRTRGQEMPGQLPAPQKRMQK